MKLIKKIDKTFPHLKRSILKIRKNLNYYKSKKTAEKDFPAMIMKDWTSRGFAPFDLEHPVTYSQKIQYAEVYETDKRKTVLSDKVAVRDWVKEKIGEKYLIPVIGVYKTPDEINFSVLPDRFVMKANHASKFNIIVKDKKSLDIKNAKKTMAKWLKIQYAFYGGFQPHYIGIEPKIIIEKYIEDSKGNLDDFKFLCFNGEVKFCWVDVGRYTNHCRNVYDTQWNLQPWTVGFPAYDGVIEKPVNFDEMVDVAAKLCKGFSHVRVDLYNVDGKIYFGEMTFSSGGGHETFYPAEYDKIIGDMWDIGGSDK